MTQRVELATVLDRLAIDAVITGYAVAVDDGDWESYRALFTADGRADYRSAGGVDGTAHEVTQWLTDTMRRFPVRQHLIVNRRVTFADPAGYPGDLAEVCADYLNPMRLAEEGDRATQPNFLSGGRYRFDLARTDEGWRLHHVRVHEKWRHAPGLSTTP
ncbi:nuclear transport factor 2 family protein [Streptomyces sp. NPDC006879]|uniref:nuclear transport factor 2 family protein n=1 Tax=Streptomyces sp. NPDC006879 TaxID=3364767 RepID=UPI0036CEA08F